MKKRFQRLQGRTIPVTVTEMPRSPSKNHVLNDDIAECTFCVQCGKTLWQKSVEVICELCPGKRS